MKLLIIFLAFISIIYAFKRIYKYLYKKPITGTKILSESKKPNYQKDNKLYYEEKIFSIHPNAPIGFWTDYIWNQKIDLINAQISEFNNDKGYFENLVFAQRYISNNLNNIYNRK